MHARVLWVEHRSFIKQFLTEDYFPCAFFVRIEKIFRCQRRFALSTTFLILLTAYRSRHFDNNAIFEFLTFSFTSCVNTMTTKVILLWSYQNGLYLLQFMSFNVLAQEGAEII